MGLTTFNDVAFKKTKKQRHTWSKKERQRAQQRALTRGMEF